MRLTNIKTVESGLHSFTSHVFLKLHLKQNKNEKKAKEKKKIERIKRHVNRLTF